MARSLGEVAEKLVASCRADESCVDELYAQDAKSVEAFAMPGSEGRVTEGREAIRGKQDWWNNSFESHSSSVDGPYLHGDDRFSVIFEVDATEKESGSRFQMKEVAVYTVDDGKIVKEEFFYNMPEG